MEKVNIGYLADVAWSHEAFKLLILDPKIDNQYIVPRKDTTDQTLYNFCKSGCYNKYLLKKINFRHKIFI